MATAKPLGKAGVKHPRKRARTVKVYTDLRLRDYARLRKVSRVRDVSMARLIRDLVLLSLEGMKG